MKRSASTMPSVKRLKTLDTTDDSTQIIEVALTDRRVLDAMTFFTPTTSDEELTLKKGILILSLDNEI